MLPDTTHVKGFELKDPDWYKVRFFAVDEKTDSGIPTMAILKFEYGDGQEIWDRCSYGEKALWKIKAFKSAIGMADTDSDWNPFIGNLIYIKVEIDSYTIKEGEKKGQRREVNKIARYMSVEKKVGMAKSQSAEATPPIDEDSLPF